MDAEEVLGAHEMDMLETFGGYSWVCSCGQGIEPLENKVEAQRSAASHRAEILGLTEEQRVSDGLALRLLSVLRQAGRPLDPSDLGEFGDYAGVMALLEDVHKRGWVQIRQPLYGDNRLMSARGVAVSSQGARVLDGALSRAADILDGPAGEGSTEAATTSPSSVDEKRRARAEFMSRLYEQTDGRTASIVDVRELGRSLGWPTGWTADIVQYLAHEGLVARPGWGSVSIAHAGVLEVEQLIAEPGSRTQHFNPVINNVTIYGNNSGQVQAGTSHSSQSQVWAERDIIERFLSELAAALPDSEADALLVSMANQNIELVRESLASEGPDSSVVRRLLPTLRDLAVNLTASGMFMGLLEAAQQLPQLQ